MSSVWGDNIPCPDCGCPKPSPWWMRFFYRRRLWLCPLCGYGWAYQQHPQDHGMFRLRRTDEPVRKEPRP